MIGREIIAKNLRRIRVAKDVSQERLAFDAGVDRSYLGGMERGEENPKVDILNKLAAALDLDLSELFAPLPNSATLEPGLKRGRKPSRSVAAQRSGGDGTR